MAIDSNEIKAKITEINITDSNNYIIKFGDEQKTVVLGDISDLSAKMAWIKFFTEENKEQKGTVYLNADDVYFSPESEGR